MGGETHSLKLFSSISIPCFVVDGQMEQIVFGECSILLTPNNWRETHKIPIKAVRDFYRDGNKRMLIGFKPIYTSTASPVWNSYKPPDVEVYIRRP